MHSPGAACVSSPAASICEAAGACRLTASRVAASLRSTRSQVFRPMVTASPFGDVCGERASMFTGTVTDAALIELRSLRDQVPGVTGGAVASADGLLIAADTDSAQPEVLAAMAAASLGLARSTSQEVGIGGLREVTIRCQRGHVIVSSVGDTRLLVILGDEGVDLARLQVRVAPAIARLRSVLDA